MKSKTQETVCCVVVTFNRVELLMKSLARLMEQTRKPDCILVVDNASSDSTRERVQSEYPAATLLAQPRNVGGAGGFRAGMEWAYEHDYDWVWVMDDDILMEPEALEKLLGYTTVSSFINPSRNGAKGRYTWESIWDVSRGEAVLLRKELSFAAGKPWVSGPLGHFEGSLIHRTVIDKIGYPDERFFIQGDDTVYGLKASYCCEVIYVPYVAGRRMIEQGRPSKLQTYLSLRNRFLVRRHLENLGIPVDRYVFWVGIVSSGIHMLRRDLVCQRPGRWERSWALIRGVLDGRRGRFGVPPWL